MHVLDEPAELRTRSGRDVQIRAGNRLEAFRHHTPCPSPGKGQRKGHGVMLRFLSEDLSGPAHSDYKCVSREATGEADAAAGSAGCQSREGVGEVMDPKAEQAGPRRLAATQREPSDRQ